VLAVGTTSAVVKVPEPDLLPERLVKLQSQVVMAWAGVACRLIARPTAAILRGKWREKDRAKIG
jgi:hypothetical protein